ncbi:MAG: hypothetical protein L0170_11605 [Acidobacteria bacterium]|nr:hypothetical protein [Acidobacteriota bacterium]
MAFIVKQESNYPKAPPGLWHAVLADVIDAGWQSGRHGSWRAADFIFQLEKRDENGKRYEAFRRYPANTSPSASLGKMLDGWLPRPLSSKERDGFDLERLVGLNAQVHIVQAPDPKGGIRNELRAILPVQPGTPLLRVEDYERRQRVQKQEAANQAVEQEQQEVEALDDLGPQPF